MLQEKASFGQMKFGQSWAELNKSDDWTNDEFTTKKTLFLKTIAKTISNSFSDSRNSISWPLLGEDIETRIMLFRTIYFTYLLIYCQIGYLSMHKNQHYYFFLFVKLFKFQFSLYFGFSTITVCCFQVYDIIRQLLNCPINKKYFSPSTKSWIETNCRWRKNWRLTEAQHKKWLNVNLRFFPFHVSGEQKKIGFFQFMLSLLHTLSFHSQFKHESSSKNESM